MTQEEKRIAIAKERGWKIDYADKKYAWIVIEPNGFEVAWSSTVNETNPYPASHFLPDYFGDLNAIRKAVIALPRDQRNRYVNILSDLTWEEEADLVDADFAWCEATAAQRAESFGLALGLW